MTTTGEDLARVTVISPQRRIDLALPGGATLGEIMPEIVKFSGYQEATPNEVVHAWVLQRLGDDPLDPDELVSKLDIRDGETLHLRQREVAMPDAAFDDVVDAVATTADTRPQWLPQHGQRVAMGVLAAVLVGFPWLLLLTDHTLFSALAVIGLAVAAGIAAVVFSRAFNARPVAATLSWCSVALGGLGAFYLLAPGPVPLGSLAANERFPLMLLLAAAGVLFFATALALAAHVHSYALLSTALTALVLVLVGAVLVLLPNRLVEISATAIALLLASTALLPWLSFQVAQVATPSLPADHELMMADETPVQSDIVSRAIKADRLLGVFLTVTAVATAILAIPVIMSGTWMALALMGCVAVALLLRARAFAGLSQRLVLLLGGVAVALMLLAWIATHPETGSVRFLVGLGLVALLTVILAVYGATLYNKVMAPTWGRLGDVLEWLAIIGIVPLLLAVLHVYTWARGIAG